MEQYFYELSFSFFSLILWTTLFGFMLRKNKKDNISYKFRSKNTLYISFLIILVAGSGIFLLYYLSDMPNVLTNNTDKYAGDCEVVIFESTRGGASLEVIFENKSISFQPEQYREIKEGNYFCKVEYFPNSKIGTSLEIISK